VKYIAPDGVEKRVNSDDELGNAIRLGRLGSESLVLDEGSGRWIKARDHAELSSRFPAASEAFTPKSPTDGPRMAAFIFWLLGLVVVPVIAVTAMGADAARAGFLTASVAIWWAVVGLIGLIFVRKRRGRAILFLVVGCIFCLHVLALLSAFAYATAHLRLSGRNLESAIGPSPEAPSGTTGTLESGSSSSGPAPAGGAPAAPSEPAGVPGPRSHSSTPPSVQNLQSLAGPAPTSPRTAGKPGAYTPPGWGGVNTPAAVPAQAADTPDVAAGGGAAGNALDLAADYVRETRQLAEQHQKALVALDPRSLLSHDTLLDRARLQAADARQAAYDRHMVSYQRDIARMKEVYLSKLVALEPTVALQLETRAKLKAAWQKSDQAIRQFFQVEQAFSGEIHAVHAFVEARLGSVPVVNGKLQLSPAEMEAYKAHLDRIQQLTEQEATVVEEMRKSGKESLDKLRQIARDAQK
jgi:hypothetical protein